MKSVCFVSTILPAVLHPRPVWSGQAATPAMQHSGLEENPSLPPSQSPAALSEVSFFLTGSLQ